MFDEVILLTDDLKIRLPKLAFNSFRRDFMLGEFRNSTAGWLWFGGRRQPAARLGLALDTQGRGSNANL